MTNTKSKRQKSNSYPPWAPRIWTGFLPGDYWTYLRENRFSIHPLRYPMTGLVAMWTLFNISLAALQRTYKASLIESTELTAPPIFIIGHWRSGTTLLHELMSLGEQFACPNNFDTFVPHHFLVSGPVIRPLIQWLMPKKRPMDNMSVHVDSPQEDDFALLIMGAMTQYRRMGFPHGQNDYARFLDAAELNEQQLEQIHHQLRYFYRALTVRYQKRLVLKSPPHTGRIEFLRRWFPGAKFVHISRNPHEVVPSTMRLWRIADDVHAFQKPRYTDHELLGYVNRCQRSLYHAYWRDRQTLADHSLAEIRFEELTSAPAETIRLIYEKLQLTGADAAAHAADEYFSQRSEHKKNHHDAGPFAAEIDLHWSKYMNEFGYSLTPTTNASSL